jgi:hypothetical protein
MCGRHPQNPPKAESYRVPGNGRPRIDPKNPILNVTVDEFERGLGRMGPGLPQPMRHQIAEVIQRANVAAARGESFRADRAAIETLLAKVPPHPVRAFLTKMVTFLVAVVPWFCGLTASPATIARRRAACLDCDQVRLGQRRPGAFCGACGCPDTQWSDLGRKVTMCFAPCPQKKWGNRARIAIGPRPEKGADHG